MIIIIELKPLRLNTLRLMDGYLWESVNFEHLVELYFDSYKYSIDTRDVVVSLVNEKTSNDQYLLRVWDAVTEFQTCMDECMSHYFGNQINNIRYRDLKDNALCLEYYKSDEYITPTFTDRTRIGYWKNNNRV